MVLETHDLLKIKPKDVISHSPIPDWAIQSLETAPFVVVRRIHAPKGQVAIGIRGKERNERFGAFLLENCIIQQIKPENLTERKSWKYKQAPVFSAMGFAEKIINHHQLLWGPGGSVGFELASGVETVTTDSDLDLIIRAPEPFPVSIAEEIVDECKKGPVKIDIIVETPDGAFSLEEYVRRAGPVLLKTTVGPQLSSNPWENVIKLPN